MTPETRLLIALARVDLLVADGVAPGYAASQVARKLAVDGAQLATLFYTKQRACADA